MQKLLILGAGQLALEMEDLIQDNYHIIGYAVNVPSNSELNNRPIYTWPIDLGDIKLKTAIMSWKRKQFIEQCEGFEFINVIGGSISSLVELGTDIFINRGAAVSAYAKIEDHTIINRGALIGHHNTIGEFVTIGPGANLAGNVTIKEQVTIGMGAQILEGRTIGKDAIIGAGTVITKDIPDCSVVLFNPESVQIWES